MSAMETLIARQGLAVGVGSNGALAAIHGEPILAGTTAVMLFMLVWSFWVSYRALEQEPR